MNAGGPSEAVLKFVDQHVESIEHLEILLLLSESERDWGASEIFQLIQSSPASIEQRLASLRNAGLLTESSPGRFQFSPANDETRQVVKDLAEAYRERRVRIIEAIYSRKTDAVQTFADAFRFKRKE